jgi:hypothetical protein
MRKRAFLQVCLAVGVLALPLLAIESFDDVAVGGKYHMELTTGDVFEGEVTYQDDSTLILEADGKPYSFSTNLIVNHTMLEPPPVRQPVPEAESASLTESQVLSFDELLRRGKPAGAVDVKISNGSSYRGVVAALDAENLRLNIEGSIIPIARGMITQIATVAAATAASAETSPAKPAAPAGPFDTVYVQNPQTDEWGRPLQQLMVVGKIVADNAQGMVIETVAGEKQELRLASVVRVIRHSEDGEALRIKRYAKALFCPQDMALIDMPPGKADRPFLKVCIDKYEYPNVQGNLPLGNVSFLDAQKSCAAKGRRLCTVEEWQWSCGGMEGYQYPYGWNPDKKVCNTEGIQKLEPSGKRINCVSKFGAYDMVGNIFEWVVSAEGAPMLMGGPYSKCQTASPGVGGGAKPQTGFRCCLSN